MNDPLTAEPAAIEVHNLVKQFSNTAAPVLDDVDLTVAKGDLVTLTGASGSGKSTLLHLLAALDRPSSGTIAVNGRDLAHRRDLNHYRRDEIGLVFQLHNLLPRLTAIENVELAMYGTKRSRRARVERAQRVLDAVGLGSVAHREPARLSGGERQRVAIARALANEPTLMLADEPTGNLDGDSAALVIDLLETLNRDAGTTILIVTHDERIIARARRRIRLRDAKLEADEDQRPYGARNESPSVGP